MDQERVKQIVEAALLAAQKPLRLDQLAGLFAADRDLPGPEMIRAALDSLEQESHTRGYALKQLASGYRLQVREELAPWVARLWEDKPARYSRALLETLALIAYRQPITRAEIEEVRGVSVSTHIIKTLQEREWIRVLGHRETPGRPALYGSTRHFLDYFNLRSLDELPALTELADLDAHQPELALEGAEPVPATDKADDAEPPATRGTAEEAAGEPGNVTPLPVPTSGS